MLSQHRSLHHDNNDDDNRTLSSSPLNKERFKINGKRLKIDDYRASLDSGVYTCVASNHKHQVANASIYLGDTGRLTIKISRLPLSIEEQEEAPTPGRVIELSCQVKPSNSGKKKINLPRFSPDC